jgi:hypothetical protein
MTQRHHNQYELILQVVRGERPCDDLSQLGIKIERIDDAWHFTSPPLEPVKLDISDVANGLLKYKGQSDALKKWARLLLCGSGFIDFSKCEEHTDWEILLNALWDAMDSGTYSDDAFNLAEELAT